MDNVICAMVVPDPLCDFYDYVRVHDIWNPFQDPPLILTISYRERDALIFDDLYLYPHTVEWSLLIASAEDHIPYSQEAVDLVIWMEMFGPTKQS